MTEKKKKPAFGFMRLELDDPDSYITLAGMLREFIADTPFGKMECEQLGLLFVAYLGMHETHMRTSEDHSAASLAQYEELKGQILAAVQKIGDEVASEGQADLKVTSPGGST